MELPLSVALVVLAGGKGQRLGGVLKPLLRHANGETLLANVLDTLGPLADAAYVVAPAELHDRLREVAPSAVLVDDPGEGPAVAVAAAARAIPETILLIAGGDLVAPSRALAEQLLERVEGQRAVVPVAAGIRQSMLAALDRAATAAIAPAPRSMYRLLAILDATDVPISAPLADVDVAEDVDRYGLER